MLDIICSSEIALQRKAYHLELHSDCNGGAIRVAVRLTIVNAFTLVERRDLGFLFLHDCHNVCSYAILDLRL